MSEERLSITEQRNPKTTSVDRISALDIVTLMNEEDATVAGAVRKVLKQIAAAVELIVSAFSAGGRLFYVGAGTSGRLGVLDASEQLPTFGSPPEMVQGVIAGGERALTRPVEGAEDLPEGGAADLKARGLTVNDAVVGISAFGNTPYVLGALEYAGQLGCRRIGLTCNPESKMQDLVDVFIPVAVGPEILSGSTRLKSGTAQKMVLNMLSTASMVRMGKTSGNLLSHLTPTSQKLVKRAIRIIGIETGADPEVARQALIDSGYDLPKAIEAIRGGKPIGGSE